MAAMGCDGLAPGYRVVGPGGETVFMMGGL